MLVNDIIESHLIDGTVRTGGTAAVRVDRLYLQDGNAPTIARLYDEYGFDAVFDPDRIGVFFDHSVLWPNVEMANRIREAMRFTAHHGLREFRSGEGISHVVAMEEGFFAPGSIVLGTDSHTCAGGAAQSLALGMGASDVVAAMITGETWLKVPQTVRLRVTGRPSASAGPKDVLLHALREFGQEPFLYRALEWAGPWVRGLEKDGAETLASMGVDMGAKCVFLPPHAGRPDLRDFEADSDNPDVLLELDIDGLPPQVAMPGNPANGRPLGWGEETINYVFIGSCTNSRYDDIAEAAAVLRGQRVHASVHCVVTPGSREVFRRAAADGHIDDLMTAGAVISPPGCGACLGTQGSVPADGDRVVSTMNRNFLGRMGNPKAEIFLVSPKIAAHTALRGRLPSPEEVS